MIILDTNVVSEPLSRRPDAIVMAWLDAHSPADLWLTAITAAELLAGVGKLADGARRLNLQAQIGMVIDEAFSGRILPFDLPAAAFYGEIVGPLLRGRHTVDHALDFQIAAIALAHGASVATRNVRHFENCGVDLIDPWVS